MNKVVFWGLLLLVVGSIGAAATFESFFGAFGGVTVHELETVDSETIREIKIDSAATDVSVVPTDGQEIVVELSGKVSESAKDTYTLNVEREEQVLEISVRQAWRLGFMNWGSARLQVRIPRGDYETVTVGAGSGNIMVEDLAAGAITLRANSGNIKASNTVAELTYTIDAGSGNISTEALSADAIHLTANSGNIEATGDRATSSYTARAGSGDLSLTNLTADVFEFSTGSGRIVALDIQGAAAIHASSGNVTVDNPQLVGDWTIATRSGRVEVDLEHPQSLIVTFDGGSGEAKVGIEGMLFEAKSEHAFTGILGDGDHKLTVTTGSGNFELR